MFQKIQKKIKEFLKEKGQGVVEYVLILGVVALIATALLVNGGMADKVVKSANTMCLPAPTRRAIACPIDPLPNKITTSFKKITP